MTRSFSLAKVRFLNRRSQFLARTYIVRLATRRMLVDLHSALVELHLAQRITKQSNSPTVFNQASSKRFSLGTIDHICSDFT